MTTYSSFNAVPLNMATYSSFKTTPLSPGEKSGFPIGAFFILVAIAAIALVIYLNRTERDKKKINELFNEKQTR